MMMEPPPARRRHGVPHRQEHAIEVHCGLLPPVGQRHLYSLAQDADTGVGDHHVQTPEAPFGGLDYPRPGLLNSYIVMEIDRLASSTADLIHHVSAASIVQVSDHHLRALSRRCRHRRCADA
jgi:hypothetical protein